MAQKTVDQKTSQVLPVRQWFRLIILYLIIPLVLFLCAGDIHWKEGWIYAVMIFVTGVGSRIWTEIRHPGLLVERAGFDSAEGAKNWDKVLAKLMAISMSFPLVIVAGLDHRFGWSSTFPSWLVIAGFILIAVGFTFASWALAENRFFSGVVRIQKDRGHQVCETGPYRIVRHPGYAGNILPLAGIVLALSSLWTIIPAGIALVIVVIRTSQEDRTLQAELTGYKRYSQKVRYRLFPGIY